MGTTGSSDKENINNQLPAILSRVRKHTSAFLAVGFGVSNREHFKYVADSGADGVVVGSRLVYIIKNAPHNEIYEHVKAYCAGLTENDASSPILTKITNDTVKVAQGVNGPVSSIPKALPKLNTLPARFGQFGGQYVPEALVDCLVELEEAHKAASADPEFWKEFEGLYGYMNRPSKLYLAERLTKHADGAKIWLKREDLSVYSPLYRVIL
jgi:tryptophan synthase